MRKRFVSVLLLVVVFAAGPAWARTDAEIEEAVKGAISQRHPTEGADFWRGLGETAPRVIVGMYEHSISVYHRVRLVEGLAWFPNDSSAVEFLKQQAENSGDDVVRNAAIKSVGTSQGAKEAEFVAKYLGHKDPQTRFAAAETLKKIDDADARTRLNKYLREEKTPWIAQKLKGQLPKPTQKLIPVTSYEDRVAPAFAGTWHGYWILPKDGAAGMRSEQATLKLTIEGANDLKGELLLGAKDKVRAVPLARVTGKAAKLSGALAGTAVPGGDPKKPKPEVAFEAELKETMGFTLVELRAAGVAGLLIVRKDPPPKEGT